MESTIPLHEGFAFRGYSSEVLHKMLQVAAWHNPYCIVPYHISYHFKCQIILYTTLYHTITIYTLYRTNYTFHLTLDHTGVLIAPSTPEYPIGCPGKLIWLNPKSSANSTNTLGFAPASGPFETTAPNRSEVT